MAEDLIDVVDEVAPLNTDIPPAEGAPTPGGHPRRTFRWVYQRRFLTAFALLGLVIVAAGVLTVVLLNRDRPAPFSVFVPVATDPVDRAQEIANHVQARYLADDGTPLVTIQAGETDNPLLPLAPTLVSVVTSPSGETFAFEAGDILFYKLCPAGVPPCTLDPSADRATLGPIYARQSLELALYGLKYVTEAESVFVLLPTGFEAAAKAGDAPPRIALYFRKSTLENKLDRPFTDTLPGLPPTPATLTPVIVAQIDALTKGTKHSLQTTTSEDKTSNLIVITPVP